MSELAKPRVLIVEDDEFFHRILRRRCEADGYQVLGVTDGRAGLKAVATWEPDIVVSDWMLPEMEGLELCQSVKNALGGTAPYFILLTAKKEIDSRVRGLQGGADDYIVKPCDLGEVMARIRAGTRIAGLARELAATAVQLKQAREELAAARAGGAASIALCPVCTRVRGGGDTWVDLEVHLAQCRSQSSSPDLCPECSATRERLAALGPPTAG